MSLTSNFESQLSFPLTNAHMDTFLNFELSEPTTRLFDVSKKMDSSTAQNTFGKKNKYTTTVIGDKSSKNGSNKVIKKPYKCPHCCKCFPKPSALTPHIYTHTGEKPFQCHIQGCHKRFAVISNLRRHFKVHQPKKVGQKNRISHKERILLVQQLVAQYGNQEKKSSSNNIPFIAPFLQPTSAVTNTDYYELPNLNGITTTTTDTSIITPSLSTTTTTTTCPMSPLSSASASSSWKYCDEYNYTATPDSIVYTNMTTSSPPLLDFHRSAISSISSSSDSSLCIQTPSFPFNDCGPVTPGDYLSTFDNSVVESISTTNDSMDPVTQWI